MRSAARGSFAPSSLSSPTFSQRAQQDLRRPVVGAGGSAIASTARLHARFAVRKQQFLFAGEVAEERAGCRCRPRRRWRRWSSRRSRRARTVPGRRRRWPGGCAPACFSRRDTIDQLIALNANLHPLHFCTGVQLSVFSHDPSQRADLRSRRRRPDPRLLAGPAGGTGPPSSSAPPGHAVQRQPRGRTRPGPARRRAGWASCPVLRAAATRATAMSVINASGRRVARVRHAGRAVARRAIRRSRLPRGRPGQRLFEAATRRRRVPVRRDGRRTATRTGTASTSPSTGPRPGGSTSSSAPTGCTPPCGAWRSGPSRNSCGT